MYIELILWVNFWGFLYVLINENKEIYFVFCKFIYSFIKNRLDSMVF